jgi:hypothetical protein
MRGRGGQKRAVPRGLRRSGGDHAWWPAHAVVARVAPQGAGGGRPGLATPQVADRAAAAARVSGLPPVVLGPLEGRAPG